MGGLAAVLALSSSCSREQESRARDYTVARWGQERGDLSLVGHRGSGDVFPEHTLEAYEGALGWGAKALEISVVQTSDGVLLCQHDLTYDRTTDLTGLVSAQPSSVLANGRVDIPRLGPRWQGEGRPRISLLDDVLRQVGGRAVLCIEAKDDAAFPALLRLLQERGLTSSVILKLHYSSTRIERAKEAGLPVFSYLGVPDDVTPERVTEAARRLDPTRDVLVIPAAQDQGPLPDEKVALAVATGVPVWVFPVHRRWEVDHFRQRGVKGIITSSYGYTSRAVEPVEATEWEKGALAPGEMTRYPESDRYALEWPEPGVIRLAVQGDQAFLTLGQLAPLRRPAGPYRVSFDIRVDAMPSATDSNFTLAFGHADDRYYAHRQGTQNGYHAILRMDGQLELYAHRAGDERGEQIGESVAGPPPGVGAWIPLALEVAQDGITWSRLDTGGRTSGRHSAFRGDYLHIGRSAPDGKIAVRALRVD